MILNDVLEVSSLVWHPRRNDEVEGLGSGQILTAEMATPLWTADVITPLTEFNTGRRLRGIINSLTSPSAEFFVYDPIGQYPQMDPDGSILGASTVQVNSVSNGQISLKGLPPGYLFRYGDYFHVEWGTNPVRRGFFEINQDATTLGTGITPLMTVFPRALPGVVANLAVTLIRPAFKARFVPDSISYPSANSDNWKMDGFQFTVMQKL